jgi:hypothetical protein
MNQASPPNKSPRSGQKLSDVHNISDSFADPMAQLTTTAEGENASNYAPAQPDHRTISDPEQHDNINSVYIPPELDAFEIDHVLTTGHGYHPSPLSMDLAFPNDLGPGKYINALDLCPALKYQSLNVKITNSPFSDHIDALEQSISLASFPWNAANAPDNGLVSPTVPCL